MSNLWMIKYVFYHIFHRSKEMLVWRGGGGDKPATRVSFFSSVNDILLLQIDFLYKFATRLRRKFVIHLFHGLKISAMLHIHRKNNSRHPMSMHCPSVCQLP